MNFDHAFILTYGRSGSTLLQGILNAIPGVTIRGENGAVLLSLMQIARGLRMGQSFGEATSVPTHPWFGAGQVDAEAYIDQMVGQFVRDVLQPPADAEMIGFKEIRHGLPKADLGRYVDFIFERFPRGCLIINTRELEATITSNHAAKHRINPDQLRETDANLRLCAEADPERAIHVHYDDYIRDPEALRPLHDFLGVPFDRDRIDAVLGTTHSVRTGEG